MYLVFFYIVGVFAIISSVIDIVSYIENKKRRSSAKSKRRFE